MAYYYPEGYFGPVCDALVDDAVIATRSRAAVEDVGDERVQQFRLDDNFFNSAKDIYSPFFMIRGQRCKVDPDTGELYDCEFEFYEDIPLIEPPLVNLNDLNSQIGLTDVFFIPDIGPDACSPFDADINILPETFVDAAGVETVKYKRERSTPVTYAVTSSTEAVVTASDLTATFDSNGNLVVGGTGTGIVYFDFEWDDNPNDAGTALGTYSVAGISFTQTPGVEEGNENNSAEVTAQTYTATITGNSGGFTVKNSGKQLCFRDNDGDDCNATLTITNVISVDTVANGSYWSEEGNTYAVWVNPETCTLPNETQQVTYFVDIPVTDTYAFTFATDDVGELFLNDETTPLVTANGGIFSGGALNTPYTATTTLNQGKVKVTVRVTNSDAGFVDGNGEPEGLAYSWIRNPGGWYIKICRGTACQEPTTSDWVRAGPHQGWGDFMDTYAVYPSNTDSLVGTHSQTWNFVVPSAGDYILEYAADNSAIFTLDGSQVATTTNFNSSDTVTVSSLSQGNHTLVGQVTNDNESENSWSKNPGGIAWTLRNSSTNVIVATSLDLLNQGDGNLIWHTRKAIEYEYYER